MLTTGTVAWAASSSSVSSEPVRSPIAATWRESTSAVSRDGLAARELELAGPQDHGMPAELDDAGLEGGPRARGGLLEEQGDDRPSSARDASGAALSAWARSRSAASSAAESSAPVRRWRGKPGSVRAGYRLRGIRS